MRVLSMFLATGWGIVHVTASTAYPDFPYPEGVDVWCGKAYRATNGSFEPGGWLDDPIPSSIPLLNLEVRPRMNLYLPSDKYASFIVDAPLSLYHGLPYVNTSFDKNTNLTNAFVTLFIDIAETASGLDLVSNKNVSINSTSNEFVFSLDILNPRLEPYEISITGASGDGAHFYTAATTLSYLPERTDGGSVAKMDNLYGSILARDYLGNSSDWTPVFPFTYYVSWDGWLENSLDNVQVFKDYGYNVIHVVPNLGLDNKAFQFDKFDQFLTKMDELELWVMYDMRWTYTNLTSVEWQTKMIYQHKSLLLWYTGDEPDGHTDPLNATKVTYDLLKSIDPYHPVSVCLNCLNFYYEEYSSGADIILSDVYPIAVNTSWSLPYNTACNTTYGCCGCDDCDGTFEDISERLDLFAHYDEILNNPPKPQWGVPQAFGNETFWSRYPSPEEVVLMNVLSINHGAMGLVMWDFPTEPGINDATSSLAKVITGKHVASFLTAASPIMTLPVTGLGRVDVAAWIVGKQMLVSIVSMGYIQSNANVTISLPAAVFGPATSLWGESWVAASDGFSLHRSSIQSLEVDLLVFNLA